MNKELERLDNLIFSHIKGDYYFYNSYGKVVDIIEIDDEVNELFINIKQVLTNKDNRIKELELSDTSKEESSINYYNEMKSLQRKFDKIEEVVNLPPSNGYFESVRDSIDKYNAIKSMMESE